MRLRSRSGAHFRFAVALAWLWLTPSAQGEVLRWPDIVRLARNHPIIGEAHHRVAAARGELAARRSIPNPSLEARLGGATGRDTAEADHRLEWGLSLALPLDWLAVRGPQLEGGRAEIEAAEEDSRRAWLEILQRLAVLFWTVAYDQSVVASLDQSRSEAARLADLVRRRVAGGEARPTELPRALTDAQRVEIELDRARAQLHLHSEQLGVWLRGESGELRVEADLALAAPPASLPTVLARVRQHPTVRGGLARLRSLAAETRTEERRRLPTLGVSGGYEVELDRRAYGGALTAGLPLWNWGAGHIAQAKAREAAEAKRGEASSRELQTAAIESYHRCDSAQRVARRYQQGILPAAVRVVTNLEKSFELGESRLLEVLDARRVALEVRRESLLAQLQQQIDCAALRALTGELAND